MKKLSLLMLVLVAVLVVGCDSATPTKAPLPTQPPVVVTVVITATPLPATATPVQPTLTSVPTVALTTTVSAPTSAATKAAGSSTSAASKPAATRTPTKPAVVPTATALALKYAAPQPIQPLWLPPWNETQKDEVKFPGSAMVFRWKPIGSLAGDECYLLTLTSEPINGNLPPRTDTFVVGCGDQTPVDAQNGFVYTLYQPGKGSPNYSSVMMDINEMWVSWTATVVKRVGPCTDDYHCKTAPLSPASYKGKFLFKGS